MAKGCSIYYVPTNGRRGGWGGGGGKPIRTLHIRSFNIFCLRTKWIAFMKQSMCTSHIYGNYTQTHAHKHTRHPTHTHAHIHTLTHAHANTCTQTNTHARTNNHTRVRTRTHFYTFRPFLREDNHHGLYFYSKKTQQHTDIHHMPKP